MIRIGSLPYINALPLTYGLDREFVKHPPAVLAALLREGELDVAMAPAAALFDDPDLSVVPGVCIGSDGPVRSVRLYHLCDLRDIRKVAVDVESRTAALMVRTVLHDGYGVSPQYIVSPEMDLKGNTEGFHAQLLIGDKALNHRENVDYVDLGEEWKRLKGLPFAYAFWVIRNGLEVDGIVEELAASKAKGIENIDKIIGGLTAYDPDMLGQYYSENIQYDLTEGYFEGFREFSRSLVRIGLVPNQVDVRIYGSRHPAQSP